jgi:dTDP-4-dehydrorhamnose 3,5-epimerase
VERRVTKATDIAGVSYEPRRILSDAKGAVLHFLRADSPEFTTFGEVYFSEIMPGAVKGWIRHRCQTQRYIVPTGRVRVVLYDDREGSPTRGALHECELGRPDRYGMLIIPPLVWYAFTSVGTGPGLIANCADIPHDSADSERASIEDGPVAYAW